MVDRHSFNRQTSTLNINGTAAQFGHASLFYFGHESNGLNAKEIDSIPTPFTNNGIDVMLKAMMAAAICAASLLMYFRALLSVGKAFLRGRQLMQLMIVSPSLGIPAFSKRESNTRPAGPLSGWPTRTSSPGASAITSRLRSRWDWDAEGLRKSSVEQALHRAAIATRSSERRF